jgi:hypothetical protein
VLPAAAEGYSLSDLIQKVGDVTGETIVFNPQDPQVRSRKVYFTGEQRIARERVFDWFRSMLTYHKLVGSCRWVRRAARSGPSST